MYFYTPRDYTTTIYWTLGKIEFLFYNGKLRLPRRIDMYSY